MLNVLFREKNHNYRFLSAIEQFMAKRSQTSIARFIVVSVGFVEEVRFWKLRHLYHFFSDETNFLSKKSVFSYFSPWEKVFFCEKYLHIFFRS